ncbi:phosphotransferase family protein [Brevibacillus reuszeri]|uniref:phosphotransferase family protein n=1 Tax=Brevibacillus reuszeri TaxID=54915 RepID=UPI00289D4688|nr:phosphotransferase [Brevibacillus reuszeri]
MSTIEHSFDHHLSGPPTFSSLQEYISRKDDIHFWWPYVAAILERHGLEKKDQELLAGLGGTYPTFLYGDVVVKLFGYMQSSEKSFEAERAAKLLLATDREIAVPRLVGEGRLFEDDHNPWSYLITTRMPGVTWQYAELSTEQKLRVAHELGCQMRRVHALSPSGIVTHDDWSGMDVTRAIANSSLPAHLVAQVNEYLAGLGSFDPVFVHGDVMFRHVFVENGHLSGIIDWGDAMVTDRHYEFAKLHLDLFNCDKSLLRAFLAASDWPMTKDFAKKAMGMALYRLAHGLMQHYAMDVFYTLPTLLPLQDIATLDELANELFAV